MAKKCVGNFANQATKELIKEQKQRQKQQKEQYINNRYKEAETLTNNIDICINKLNNTINTDCNAISIEEFIKKDLKELSLPEKLLRPYEKPLDVNIRKSNIMEKIFKSKREEYDLYVQQEQDKHQKEYDLYI